MNSTKDPGYGRGLFVGVAAYLIWGSFPLIIIMLAFASPLDLPELAERSIACASISKSHAAPGFRSGWCIGPAEFCARLLPLSETMLFGSQPFIADMTAEAVSSPSPIAAEMMARFQRRAKLIHNALHGTAGIHVHMPQAGMFALLDIRASGLSGSAFARALLTEAGVAYHRQVSRHLEQIELDTLNLMTRGGGRGRLASQIHSGAAAQASR
mgnify:CR=1 FL=1